jgi:hypothetical protein
MLKGCTKPKSIAATKTPPTNVGEIHSVSSHRSAIDCGARGRFSIVKRNLQHDETQIDELENEELASDSAGQSGDAQGLSQNTDADEESVEELAETDQAYEAEAMDGLEDAADHPERPVQTREDKAR